ncbi:MAG: DUF4252 domain-containing protein [Cyclobacteriaceae bacterium]|nr:DUF4252 domain-containing protein [Cyclobacteriaceae bacterium]
MKALYTFAILIFVSMACLGQSYSYQTLKEKFTDQPNVHSFSFNGWVGRMVLNLAGEQEFRHAVKDLNHIRFLTIPRSEFSQQQVSVTGFKNVLKKDGFEELAFIRDHGDEITLYLREGKNNKNRYFALIEEPDEIIAIELKGYIDPRLLNPENTRLAFNQ